MGFPCTARKRVAIDRVRLTMKKLHGVCLILLTTACTTVITSIPQATAAVLKAEIIDSKGVHMLLVPAGKFTMGSNQHLDEQPIHTVYLDAYYIDGYEITNALYASCVQAGICQPPRETSSYRRSTYFGNSEFDDYPVVYVDWHMAVTYCSWRGARLPTEAEWEKAARGTDARTYPWGEGIDITRANYDQNLGDTTAVGTYEAGLSIYGVYDLVGNVWEWVADWYQADYYSTLPEIAVNPQGPQSGQIRALRSGAASFNRADVRPANRFGLGPMVVDGDIGFRCSASP